MDLDLDLAELGIDFGAPQSATPHPDAPARPGGFRITGPYGAIDIEVPVREQDPLCAAVCRDRRLTRTQLAGVLGTDYRSVQRWVDKRRPVPRVARRLLELIQRRPDVLPDLRAIDRETRKGRSSAAQEA